MVEAIAERAPAQETNGYERRRLKTRAAIVDAAIELFQAQGVQATSVDEICERAEVSVRTFFNHFETRERLYEVIAHQRSSEAAEVLGRYAADPRPFSVRLTEFFAEFAGYLAERPAYRDFVGQMMQLHPARGHEAVRSGALFEGVRALVASGFERGDIGGALSVDSVADVIVGAVVVLTANWSANEGFDVLAQALDTARVLVATTT